MDPAGRSIRADAELASVQFDSAIEFDDKFDQRRIRVTEVAHMLRPRYQLLFWIPLLWAVLFLTPVAGTSWNFAALSIAALFFAWDLIVYPVLLGRKIGKLPGVAAGAQLESAFRSSAFPLRNAGRTTTLAYGDIRSIYRLGRFVIIWISNRREPLVLPVEVFPRSQISRLRDFRRTSVAA